MSSGVKLRSVPPTRSGFYLNLKSALSAVEERIAVPEEMERWFMDVMGDERAKSGVQVIHHGDKDAAIAPTRDDLSIPRR